MKPESNQQDIGPIWWKERTDWHKRSSGLCMYPGTHRCPSPINKYNVRKMKYTEVC